MASQSHSRQNKRSSKKSKRDHFRLKSPGLSEPNLTLILRQFENNHSDTALSSLAEVLAENPNNPEAKKLLLFFAKKFLAGGKSELVEKVIEISSKHNVSLPELHCELVSNYGKRMRISRAKAVFANAINTGIATEDLYVRYIKVLRKIGNWQAVSDVCDQSLEQFPTPENFFRVLTIFLNEKLHNEAESIFVRAIEAGFGNDLRMLLSKKISRYCEEKNMAKAGFLYDLAKRNGLVDKDLVHMMIKGYTKAQEARTAYDLFCNVELDHLDRASCTMLINSLSRVGMIDNMLDVFSIMDGLGFSDRIAYASLINSLRAANRPGLMRKYFEQAKKAGKVDGYLYGIMIKLELSVQNTAEANRLFNEAQSTGCVDETTYAMMIREYFCQGDVFSASKMFQAALQTNKIDAALFKIVVEEYLRIGLIEPAESVYQKALEHGINELQGIHYALLSFAICSKHNNYAISCFEKFSSQGSDLSIYSIQMIEIYGVSGHLEKARELFDKIEKTPQTYRAMMRAYKNAGEFTDAVEIYKLSCRNNQTDTATRTLFSEINALR